MKHIIDHEWLELDDELKSYAVWTEGNKETGRVELVKVELYDRYKHNSKATGVTGIVRAKDELGVYRVVESFNP